METTIQAELIPREVLFGNPERTGPRLSPDGRRLSYLAPRDGVLNVWIAAIGEEEAQPLTDDRGRGIHDQFWAHDNRHVLYIQDTGGNENWRLHAVDVESGAVRDLTPLEGVQANVVRSSKQRPEELLVGLNQDNPQLHDVYRLHLPSGTLEKVVANPGNVVGWVADDAHRVRAALGARADGGFDLLAPEGDGWRTLLTWSQEDALNSVPLRVSADGKTLYLLDSREAETSRLVAMDLETGQTTVVFEDPSYDVTEVVFHPDTSQPQLAGVCRERLEWTVLDPSVAADLDALQALQDGELGIVARDHADRMWLVSFSPDDGPVSYYAYDRQRKQATFLFDQRPKLRRYRLARMQPISYQARDGLRIHGYLTLPPGAEPKNLPMVLNVHGGPWFRDTWGFNPECQWLANRGYAVLQVNYRGSAGYGKRFLNAGDREWGGKMFTDLLDAVDWAIAQGIADPQRIAIYGGSYGGYAALCGATFAPERFCCVVSVCGPSNLLTWITSLPPYWQPLIDLLHRRIGHPERDAEFLRSRSPLFHVDRIRAPMLIGQGANDPRVPRAESEQIVAALKDKGIDHEYLCFPDEGHGFERPENRLAFYAAAERFLARHLGGRCED